MGRWTWVFSGIFGAVGLGMLLGAAFAAQRTLSFRAEEVRAPGTVVQMEGGRPVVEFTAPDGTTRRVVGEISSNPPAYERGEAVTVLHHAGDPDDARIEGWLESWFAATLFGGLGTVFTGVGGGFLIAEVRKRRLREWLRQFGVRIEAKYTGVLYDTSVRINRRHPWRLTAQWLDPATELMHTFESDMLFYDPTDLVQRETVEVWIDPRNPRRHHLDTAFLPRQG
jgi:hypothetical protein